MKEQFLNLSGLTDLVTYMKLCIAQHKVIIPRASFSLFPETGDKNNIYIDTSNNAIYRWNDTDKKFVLLAKPPRTIAISEGTNNGEITLKVDNIASNAKVHGLTSTAFTESNKFATAAQGAKADSAVQTITLSSGTKNGTIKIKVNNITTDNIEVAGLGSAAFSDIGIFAAKSHTHKKDEVGLGNVDNTADINKSVKYATSAGAVSWKNITDKPTLFPPQQHNHDSLYYRKNEVDSLLSSKSDTGHTHVQFIQEVKFSNGTYSDPLNGTAVAIKASGGIASDLIYEGGKTLADKYQAKGSYAAASHKQAYTSGECTTYNADDNTMGVTPAAVKKAFGIFGPKAHTHKKSDITDFPTSLPASDVYGWAKASSKPSYTKSEVGLGNVDNTADANKSVKYAGSSGSSNTVVYTALTNTDLNTLQTEGRWYYAGGGNTCTNIPVASAAFELYVGRNASGWRYQQFTVTSGEIYIRVFDSSNWGSWRKLAFTSDTVTAASSVPWSGITGKPTTFTPASHTHNYAGSSSAGGTANASYKLSNVGQITTVDALNNFNEANVFKYATMSALDGLNGLGKNDGIILSAPWSSANYGHQIFLDDNSYTIAHRYRNSGTWSAWKTLIDSSNIGSQSVSHASTADSTTTATQLSSSAGSATQPVYFSGGKPVATTYTLGKSVPSNAVFTDTNTWRGIQNNLTSDSTTDSLSAAQGKVLKGLVDGKAASSHTHTIAQISNLQSTLDGKSNTNHTHDLNQMINTLTNGTSDPVDTDYYIAQYAGGGSTTTTYHRRPHSALWNYIKSKANSVYQPKGSYAASSHTHDDRYYTESEINTKLASKSEISHTHNYVVGSYTGNGGLQKPNYFGTNKVGFLMMNATVNGDSNYKDWIIMDCYSGTDVGGGVAFGVNRQKLGAYIMRSTAARTAWVESAELLHTQNYTSYTVTKTGSGASGTWGINITGASGSCTGNAATASNASKVNGHTVNSDVPSGAKFTDTNTTYPISYRTIDNNFASKYRTQTKGNTSAGDYISTLRCETNLVPYAPQYGSGLGWGRGDTHGYLYMNYNSPQVYVGAGNADKLNWAKQLAFADHTHSYTEITNRPTLIKAVSKNGYWGMADHDGSDSNWIRTTTAGIIPYQSGGAGAGHCGIGTSSWYFSSAYIDTVNCVNASVSGHIDVGGYIQSSNLINTYFEYQSNRGSVDWRFGAATGTSDENFFGFYDAKTGKIPLALDGNFGNIYVGFNVGSYESPTAVGVYLGGQVAGNRAFIYNGDSYQGSIWIQTRLDGSWKWFSLGRACSTALSDIRLKGNIRDTEVEDATKVIESMKIRSFERKDSHKKYKIGFIADELEQLDPNLVDGGGEVDGHPYYKSVNNLQMLAYVVKGMQELNSKVTILEKENKRLKQKLNMCN